MERAPRSCGIVLAAGASRRFGGPKLLACVEGQPLLRKVCRAYLEASLDQLVVVLGARAEELRAALDGLDVRVVVHPGWEAGMVSSAQAGLRAADPLASWFLISPADLPGLEPAHVESLLAAARASGGDRPVVPLSGGRRGHPLALPVSLRAEALALPAEARLSDLLRIPQRPPVEADGFPPGILRDVDVPSDLAGHEAP